MTLRDAILDDATMLVSQNEFGELIEYNGREIEAIVFRESLSVLAEDGDTVLPSWEIHVANSSTLGISSTELDVGSDVLVFPPREGQDPEEKTIVRLVGHDHGMLILECR